MGHHASRKWAITPSGHHGITQRIQTLASQANGPSRHQSLSLSLPISQCPTTDAQCPPPPRCRTLASQAAQAPQPSPADSPSVRRLPIHRRCLGAWWPAGHRGTACHRPPVISRRPQPPGWQARHQAPQVRSHQATACHCRSAFGFFG
jgi:hypothetical protein